MRRSLHRYSHGRAGWRWTPCPSDATPMLRTRALARALTVAAVRATRASPRQRPTSMQKQFPSNGERPPARTYAEASSHAPAECSLLSSHQAMRRPGLLRLTQLNGCRSRVRSSRLRCCVFMTKVHKPPTWSQLLARIFAYFGATIRGKKAGESKAPSVSADEFSPCTASSSMLPPQRMPADGLTFCTVFIPSRRLCCQVRRVPYSACAASAESRATGAHETAQRIAESIKTIRYEHYTLLLGHADDMELLAEAANALAQAEVPCDIADGIALTRMTGIRKPGGGVQMTRMSRAMCASC